MLGVGDDRGGVHQLHHPTWDIDPFCGSDVLNEYLTKCLNLNGYLNRLYDNFVGWGFAKCNFVGEFDNLIEDLEKVFNHIGLKYNAEKLRSKPKYNPSKKSQEPDENLVTAINDVEDYYFKVKKGFQ